MNILQTIFSIKNEYHNGFKRKVITICGIKFKFKDPVYKFKIKRLNKRISKYKYVHIMHNQKFNKPFVDFLNKYFDKNKHLVVCRRQRTEFPFPEGENVIEIKDLSNLDFGHNDKVICHSLFVGGLVDYLYNHPDILKNKAYWMIWGGDLYNAPRDEKNDFVRQNCKGYISDTDGDCEVAMKKYNSHPITIEAGYIFPITKSMIANAVKVPHDYIQIQINNSCDDSILEMLDILSKFKNENIKVKTILSYGKMEYKDSILKKGKEIFGDKFVYTDTYMEPEEYANELAQNDILILNQNRQQGLGNSFATLALGGKLFIRSEITTYRHFNSRGIKVFDTHEIKNMNFADFVEYKEDVKLNNMQKSLIFFDDKYYKKLWENVFNSIDTLEYWKERAEKYGKHSVYNMSHPLDELSSVDEKQQKIYLNILKNHIPNECFSLDFDVA